MRTIRVKIKPNAHVNTLKALSDGTWMARVTAPPIDGKANDALVALVAAHFALCKTQVSIKSGAKGRMKLVQLDD